jgi:hypothetical protein
VVTKFAAVAADRSGVDRVRELIATTGWVGG